MRRLRRCCLLMALSLGCAVPLFGCDGGGGGAPTNDGDIGQAPGDVTADRSGTEDSGELDLSGPEAVGPTDVGADIVPPQECTPPGDTRLRWTFLAQETVSQPAIGPYGRVLVPCYDYKLHALDPVSGEPVWEYQGEAWPETPAVDPNGFIYLPIQNSLFALDAADGTELWSFTAADEMHAPAIGSDGVVYAPSEDGNVYALYPTGSLKWTFEAEGRAEEIVLGDDGTIFITSAPGGWKGYVEAIRASDGTQKWKFGTPSEVILGSFYGLAVGPDGTVYSACGDDHLYALNSSTGSVKWAFDQSSGTPAFGLDGTVFVRLAAPEGALYALNPTTGGQLWMITKPKTISTPAVGADGTLYATDKDGQLYALDPSSGSERWSYSLTFEGYGVNAPLMGGDGALYVNSGKNKVYAINIVMACEPCALGCITEVEVGLCLESGAGYFDTPIEVCDGGQICLDGACITCQPQDHLGCFDGHPYHFDSCGHREEQVASCADNEICEDGVCVLDCQLECDVVGESLAVELTCGAGSLACEYNYDTAGRPIFMDCEYSNGVSFKCSIDYDSVGMISGSCTGEAESCDFSYW